MPMFLMHDDDHKRLKAFALAHETTMSAVLRSVLAAFFANPESVPPQADARTKTWFCRVYLWDDTESLRATSEVFTVAGTGTLPELAATFAGAPELEALVLADLPRFRQRLAQVQHGSSMRVRYAGGMCQVDVSREAPEGEAAESTTPVRFRS